MAAITFRVKITKEDFQFEAEGDKAFVLEMLNRFEGSVSLIGVKPIKVGKQTVKPIEGEVKYVGKPLSVGEFVRRLGLKRHTDIVLSFGYYLEKYSGVTEFTPADINRCYYDAKMESSNTSQMLIRNIKHGNIMQARTGLGKSKAKKGYVLTQSGERFIDDVLAKVEQ